MKTKQWTALIIIATFALLFANPSPVNAQDINGDKIIFGETYTLHADEEIDGSLVILGGNVTLENESLVDGDILLSGGVLDIQGEVDGDITALGGTLNLGTNAVIDGDINLIGTSFNRSIGARVNGDVHYETDSGEIGVPEMPRIPVTPPVPEMPNMDKGTQPIGALLWAIFLSLSMGAIAMLLGLFINKPIHLVAENLNSQPVLSLGIGLLTLIAAPLLIVLLVLTIVLIPVALLLVFALSIALIFAWLAVGYEIGNRIASLTKTTMAQPVSFGLGTWLLTFVAALVWHIPCIGWLFTVLILSVGLGAVLVSRFGTKPPQLSGSPDMPPPSGEDENAVQVEVNNETPLLVAAPDEKPAIVKRAPRVKKVQNQTDVTKLDEAQPSAEKIPPEKPRRRKSTGSDQTPQE